MIIDGIEVKGVTSDSKKVKEGYVFVAIKGDKFDGNSYIHEAINKGAVMVFTEEESYIQYNIPIKKTTNARRTLASLCNQFYNYPSDKLVVIGVTGTNGKTTTTHLIYKILMDYGIPTGLIGTLYTKINYDTYHSSHTTPIPEEMFWFLSEMVKNKVKVVVMEVSSHGLKSNRVFGINFDIAIHTNIDRDHMNYHKTIEDYVQSKKILFDMLPKKKTAIINIDDTFGLKLLEGNDEVIVITYGLNPKATITASSIDYTTITELNYCTQRSLNTLGNKEIEAFEHPIVLPLIGKHNMYNCLAAITCGLLLDIPITSIADTVKKFKSIERRMEVIYDKKFKILDDYCHNPSSYEAVLSSLQSIRYNNLYIVNAIRGNRGIEINKENAETLKQWLSILKVNDLIITASKDFCGPMDLVSWQERDAFLRVLGDAGVKYQFEESLYTSIKKAIGSLENGDLLLLLGAQGMNYGRKISYSIIDGKDMSIHLDTITTKESIYVQ